MSKNFVFRIDRGVPMPDYSRTPKYNLAKLKPGDSFKLPKDKVASLRVYVNKFKKRSPKQKFLIRAISRGFSRCWRTK